MDEHTAQDVRRRHQPSMLRRIIGDRICRDCRQEWPCDPYQLAGQELLRAAEPGLHRWMANAVAAELEGRRAPRWNGGRFR